MSMKRRSLSSHPALTGPLKWVLVGAIQAVLGYGEALAIDGADDFNDNSKSTAKWGTDAILGHGAMNEVNQRLEYTCSSAGLDDDAIRPWILTRFPYNADWTVQIDLVNKSDPATSFANNSFGLRVINPVNSDQDLSAELYNSGLGGLPARTGFFAELYSSSTDFTTDVLGGSGVTNGAVRMEFTSATKVIEVFYDEDVGDGYQWISYGTFSVDGSDGIDGDMNWGMTDADQFPVYVYGFSAAMTVSSGQVYGDNFASTGGVTPSSAPSPNPLGNFQFNFPTNNPALVKIMNVLGNYRGVTPTVNNRNYDVDVAQDETGKLMVMGSMDGVKDSTGSTDISLGIGALKTVNAEPTALLKGSFSGSLDDVPASSSGSANGPVEIIDIGAGTNGVACTGSFKAKVGGAPSSGKNQAFQFASPPGVETNLHASWSINLDLSEKLVKGKTQIVASATLQLPSGDLIQYPERAVKYSNTKGYSLAFKGGTNTTIQPPAIDKKSSVGIKGLTFTKQGNDWVPTGGTIDYRFSGQAGTANLTDFVAP